MALHDHVGAGYVGQRGDQRREHAGDLRELRRHQHEPPPVRDARVTAGTDQVGLRERACGGREFVQPGAPGDAQLVRPEVPRAHQVVRRELIVQQRQRRGREPGVARVAPRWGHLVRLVVVVHPVAVDEPVLQADGRNGPPARFEHERAAPPSGLGIGDGHARTRGIEGGAELIHDVGGPRELQVRDAPQQRLDQRPRVAAADNRGLADVRASAQRRQHVAARPPERLRLAQPRRRGECVDGVRRLAVGDQAPRIGQAPPPRPCPVTRARPEPDRYHAVSGQTCAQLTKHGADVLFRRAALPERRVDECRDGGSRPGLPLARAQCGQPCPPHVIVRAGHDGQAFAITRTTGPAVAPDRALAAEFRGHAAGDRIARHDAHGGGLLACQGRVDGQHGAVNGVDHLHLVQVQLRKPPQ